MNFLKLLLMFALCVATMGSANAQQSKPCERGQQQVKLAGVDPDVTRCQIFIMQQTIGNAETRAADAAASAELATKDLAAAQSRAAQREKDWSDYFAAYIGSAAPAAATTSAPAGLVGAPFDLPFQSPGPGLVRQPPQ